MPCQWIGGRLRQPVDQRDLDRLAAISTQRRTGNRTRVDAGVSRLSSQQESVGGRAAEAFGLGSASAASAARPQARERRRRGVGHAGSSTVMPRTMPVMPAERRRASWTLVSDLRSEPSTSSTGETCVIDVAVEQPVAGALRRPRHRHRRSRRHQLRDHVLAAGSASNGLVAACRRRGCRPRSRSRAGASGAAACSG